jgi:hypothetical protein
VDRRWATKAEWARNDFGWRERKTKKRKNKTRLGCQEETGELDLGRQRKIELFLKFWLQLLILKTKV